MSPRLAIGVGCRRGCQAETIVALVSEALARVSTACEARRSPRRGEGDKPQDPGEPIGSPPRLFTVADKVDEPGLSLAAAQLGLELVILPRTALDAVTDRIASPSRAAMAALGLASVSEAAALAGAEPGGRLVLARIAAGGATCAIAEAAP